MSERGARYVAMLHGERFYFSSKPCKRGHISERLTDNGVCVECRRALERDKYKERYELKIKPRRTKPEEKAKAAKKMAEIRAKWSDDQIAAHRDAAKIRSRAWRQNNPAHRNALKRKYIADKGNRTPKWADLTRILEIYKGCPEGYHVDHIVPLRAKNVSGRHVHYNLQYLPAIDNMRKNNRFDLP